MWNLIARTLLHRPVTMARPEALAASLDMKARRKLGRSLSIRQFDAGSCNGCELEIQALNNPLYDIERFGIRFVASPRHADLLLVTGPVTRNMREALERTYAAAPAPKWVIAAGDCAALASPREKAGVYAVRAGPPLARSLRALARGGTPRPWTPRRRHLALISTGERYAVASRGAFKVEGAWVWRLKDWIDRRWMRMYQDAGAMRSAMAARPAALPDAGTERHLRRPASAANPQPPRTAS